MSQSVMQKDCCANFKVKITVKVYITKIWLSIASSKLLVLVQANVVWWYALIRLSVFWENWMAVLKVKVTSKVWNVNDHFVWTISPESFNFLLPYLVLWCIIMSHNFLQTFQFAIFKVKGTARAYLIKIWLSALSSELLTLLQSNFVWCYIIVYQSVMLQKIGLLCPRSRSQQNFKMSMNVQTIASEPLNLLLPNLVKWCIIMSWSVLWKDWFAVFKVKVTVKALYGQIITFCVSSEVLILLQR